MPLVPQTGPEGVNFARGLMVLMQADENSEYPPAGIVILPTVVTVPKLVPPDALEVSSFHTEFPSSYFATRISAKPFSVLAGVRSLLASHLIPTLALLPATAETDQRSYEFTYESGVL